MLVDTSVWVDHLRRGNEALAERLEEGVVATHPFVIGELACGRLRRRTSILALLNALPRVTVAEHGEALGLIEARRLDGQGLGWIDIHLLASALLESTPLWTLDARLARQAGRLGLAFRPV